MTRIEVDPSLRQKLGGMTERVELCEGERVVGLYLPEAEYLKMLYKTHEIGLSKEEIARRRAEPGGRMLQEIWKELGVK